MYIYIKAINQATGKKNNFFLDIYIVTVVIKPSQLTINLNKCKVQNNIYSTKKVSNSN